MKGSSGHDYSVGKLPTGGYIVEPITTFVDDAVSGNQEIHFEVPEGQPTNFKELADYWFRKNEEQSGEDGAGNFMIELVYSQLSLFANQLLLIEEKKRCDEINRKRKEKP